MLGTKFSKKLRGSLLNGVYAVVNLPDDERSALGPQPRARRRMGPWARRIRTRRSGSSAAALEKIRADVAPWKVPIPLIPEIDGAASATA